MTRMDLFQNAASSRLLKCAPAPWRGIGTLAIAALALAISPVSARSQGIPEDWADRHVVFSNPGSLTDAVNHGTVEKWYNIVNNPRFQAQSRRRSAAAARANRGDNRSAEADSVLDRLENAGKGKGGKHGDGGGTTADDGSLQKDWSMNIGVGGKVFPDQFPAKYSFDASTAFCDSATTPDFVVYPTGLPGTTSQPSIIAYDNLYSGCSNFTTGPLEYWNYNVAGGTIITSPVLSLDGTQVAFIATGSSVHSGASLVILKWKAPATKNTNNTTIVTLSNTAAASYRACVAPCMTVIALSGNPDDSLSSPYYDYGNDVLYVGDDAGVLHKLTNIFLSGTPAEITGGGTTSGWPQTLSLNNKLTSPVYDFGTGNLLVGTFSGVVAFSGTLVRIPGGGGAVGGGSSNIVVSADLANATGVASAPIVDAQAGRAYVVVYCNTGKTCANPTGQAGTGAIYQFSTSFAAANAGLVSKTFGTATIKTQKLYSGAFDNIYFSSANSTGNFYFCGMSSGTADRPQLYQVPITANVMGTPVAGPEVASGIAGVGVGCSPVTEILNGTTDLIFLSNQANNVTAAPIACPSGSGCIMSFNVTSGAALTTSKATSARAGAAGGTSGIIIDNVVASPTGTSQVYFTPLSNGTCIGNGTTGSGTTTGCAVQLSQAGLN
ncbi:MAG: hypothetical protein M3P45_15550 [Acidobacteriota bacterium]|nr:hypothetical protein [Acidobacteriota bacterium]